LFIHDCVTVPVPHYPLAPPAPVDGAERKSCPC